MKKLVILIITVLPLLSNADTLDYWSIYLNDSLIGRYNSLSQDNELTLKRTSIQEYDTISIIYGNDHPCTKCEYYYAIKDKSSGTKILVERRSKLHQKISFPLLEVKELTQYKEFELFVYNATTNSNKYSYILLLILRIE